MSISLNSLGNLSSTAGTISLASASTITVNDTSSLKVNDAGTIQFKPTGSAQSILLSSNTIATSDRSIVFYDPNGDCQVELTRKPIKGVVTNVTRNINQSESEYIQLVSATALRTYTLPAVADAGGCKFKFIISVSGNNRVTLACPAGTLHGIVSYGANGPSSHLVYTVGTNAVFEVAQTVGSWAELTCDGVKYYISGVSGIAGGFV